MTNLEGLWAERFSYSKQQFPKVSQTVRANERPFLPQAVCPALSCRGMGWREGSLCFWVTLTGPATLWSARPEPVINSWRGLEMCQVMTSYHTVPGHILVSLKLISGTVGIIYSPNALNRRQPPRMSLCSSSAISDHRRISERKLPASPSALISWLLSLIFTSLKAFGEWCASWQEQIAPERRSMPSLLAFLFPENLSLTSVTSTRLRQTSYSKSVLKSSWQLLGTYCVPGTVSDSA